MRETVARTPHQRAIGLALIVLAAIAICALTLTPQSDSVDSPHLCLICGELGGVDAFLNVLLFTPLGVGLALRGVSFRRAIFGVLLLATLIELAQFWIIPGRDATTGDVIANSLGGIAGWSIGNYYTALISPRPFPAMLLTAIATGFWLLMQTVENYALTPDFPRVRYYGQLGREFENLSKFPGPVLSATIDTVGVPDYGYAKSESIREALSRGALVTTVVGVGKWPPPPKLAPVLRVDNEGREMLLLAQSGAAMVFGVRTGAMVLRLRPLKFSLNHAFESSSSIRTSSQLDTVLLSGQYTGGQVNLHSESSQGSNDRSIAVSAMLGWTLFAPFQWYVTGSPFEKVLSALWMIVLAFPIGYWLIFFAEMLKNTRERWALAAALTGFVEITIGVYVIPLAFGLQVDSMVVLSAWALSGLGILGGALAGESIRASSANAAGTQQLPREDSAVLSPKAATAPENPS